MTGEREEARVKCRYIFTKEDIIKGKPFKNNVLHSNYPIDIHSLECNKSILKENNGFYLPLESLMSFDYENLYVAGRLVGAEFEAHGALRIQRSCASMGEAVAKDIYTKLYNLRG